MTTLINANNVGDKYRDATGGVSTIVHVGQDRVVVRRASSSRFPTFTVYNGDHTQLVAGGFKTLAAALAA